MINSYRALVWFALQLAIAIGGGVGAFSTITFGVLAFFATLGAMAVSLSMSWKVRDTPNALKPISDGVAVVGMGAFLLALFGGNLVLALACLLFFAQQALNLVLREYRQLYFGLVIGFAFVLAGASECKSGWYLLIFMGYGLSVSYCLGEVWLDNRHLVQRGAGRPPAKSRFKVAGMILGLALVIYLVMPRPPAANLGGQYSMSPDFYRNQAWEQEAESGQSESGESDGNPESAQQTGVSESDTSHSSRGDKGSGGDNGAGEGNDTGTEYQYEGFSEQFDIQQAGNSGESGDQGRNSNDIIAHMKAPHGAYLKVRTFDTFDGISWSTNTKSYTKMLVEWGAVKLDQNAQGNYRQEISIKESIPAWIPAASQPIQLWLPASVIAVDAWGHPLLPGPLVAGTTYSVESNVQYIDGRISGGKVPPRSADLQLPADFDSRIKQLATEVTHQYHEPLAKAAALEHHLRTEYSYSFSSIFDSQGKTPLDTFLFEEKRGHCEYFASAMAMMLRSIDIPSRLVTGFSATQKNPLTGYYEIRALDGHAWVEAWIEGSGWLTFEPTAFYSLPEREEEPLSASQIDEYVESLTKADEALDVEDVSISRVLTEIWRSLTTLVLLIFSYIKLFFIRFWPMTVLVLLIGFALYFTRRYWQVGALKMWSRWRIRFYKPKNQEQALAHYLYHLQKLASFEGAKRLPGDDIHNWSDKLSLTFGQADAWGLLADVVNRTYYENQQVELKELKQLGMRAMLEMRG